jgi:hypothetical protein
LAGLPLVEFMQLCRAGSPRLSTADQSRGALACGVLKACASEAEKGIISDKQATDIKVVTTLKTLHDRFIGRMINEYTTAGLAVPRDMAKFVSITVSSVENRLRKMNKEIPGSKLRLQGQLTAEQKINLPSRPADRGPAKKKQKRGRK